jgi:Protein of unknown function (DUF2997)
LKTIEITVDNKGECTVQTKGFAGSSCREASRFVEKALGVVVSDTATAEMYQGQTQNHPLRQSNG